MFLLSRISGRRRRRRLFFFSASINCSKMFGILLVFAMSLFATVESYISQYKWNQDLMQSLIDDYEIVYPFQVRDRSRIGIDTKNYYFTNTSVHFDRCSFVIKSSYGRFKIHVELNKLLLPSGATFKHIFNDTSQMIFKGNVVENCYYQGVVHNEENSKVTLSTCNGLQGSIVIHNQTYFIVPMKGGDQGKRHPHVFIRAKWHQKISCGNSGITEWNHQLERKQTYLKRQNKRDVASQTKYIELALVVDHSSFLQMDGDMKLFMQFFIEVVNGLDLIFKETLKTRISLVYFESWSTASNKFFSANDDITQTLLNFIEYSSKNFYSDSKDVSILVSATKFLRHEVSMAASGNVCNGKSAGVVQFLNRFESFRLSVEMSHNIAHILGIRHDDAVKSTETSTHACDCADKSGCLMSRSMSGRRNRFVSDFSSCSLSDFTSMLSSGQGSCLFNKPLEEGSLRLCGNKIVDPGELCDCGSLEECDLVDPCCDAVTCTLKKGAECGAGPCCDSCKLITDAQLCRSADDDCDVPEYCSGKSGQCPDDGHMIDGTMCGDLSEGYCYYGRCQTSKKQCRSLWGQEADVADSECFEKLNVAVLEPDITKSSNNAMCSFLQCKGGSETAKLPIYSKTEFAEHGRSFECKTASSGNKSVSENDGLVKDGTKCGTNKICVDRSCVQLASLTVEANCPSNHGALHCSGHGVCTNLNLCYCNEGWSGTDCSIKLEKQRPVLMSTTFYPASSSLLPKTFNVPSTNSSSSTTTIPNDDFLFGSPITFSSRLDTYAMLIILGGVAGGVLMLLLFLALCYKRRTSSVLHKKKLLVMASHKDFERGSESSVDTAHRSIRFGEMPSYRDEKVQSKRNKKQRSLHLIKESADEKDSISNKSKESAHSATSAVDETESMLFAVLQQNDLSRYPERGILKNGPVRVNSELETCPDGDDHRMNGGIPTGGDGYESEPPYPAFRVFENSMRKLNECDPYRRRSNNHNSDQDPPYISYAGSAASAPVSRRTASSVCAYAPPTNVRSGYCTDEDGGRRMPPQRRYIDSSPEMPSSSSPPSQRDHINASNMKQHLQNVPSLRSSPTNSAGSPSTNGAGRSLSQAQPLKLKNIEYLLKQLDRKSNTSLSPSSSTELSVPEADKEADDGLLEESSNTESHRDGQYAVRRDFPNEYAVGGGAIPSLISLNVGSKMSQWRPSAKFNDNYNHDMNYAKYGSSMASASASSASNSESNRLLPSSHQLTPPTLNRLNLINYNSSQSNICSSCQLPTPDHCCGGDGRVSSDGSCDNNICVCKSMRNEK